MQAIEFEATTFQHTVRIPDTVPDGVSVRIVLSFDNTKTKNDSDNKHWKNLLGAMPNVGRDEDFTRSTQSNKFSQFPSKLKLSRDEMNDRRPEYLTIKVDEIDMPARDECYEKSYF
jgi:hypothetical protein